MFHSSFRVEYVSVGTVTYCVASTEAKHFGIFSTNARAPLNIAMMKLRKTLFYGGECRHREGEEDIRSRPCLLQPTTSSSTIIVKGLTTWERIIHGSCTSTMNKVHMRAEMLGDK